MSSGNVYFWYLLCERACTFMRTSPEIAGDPRWMQERCPYDGSALQVFQPADNPAT